MNKLKRTDEIQLRALMHPTPAATYARANSPRDWWRMPDELTDFVQMYARLNQSERAALAHYAGGGLPTAVRYTAPAMTVTRRREYDELGRLRVEEESVSIKGSKIEMQFANRGAGPRRGGRMGSLATETGRPSYGRSLGIDWWTR